MEDSDLQLDITQFCFDHFQHNDTDKDNQYKTPLASRDNSPNDNESESIEVVDTPSNTYCGPLQESTISSASTNNTDICVLDSHLTNEDIQIFPILDDEVGNHEADDEFIVSENGDDVFLRDADILDKNEDFTVLQKPTKTRNLYNCEESTEVLMLINSEYQEERKPTYSGTDSDVEVLMSEEIIESDWSSGNALEPNPKESTVLKANTNALNLNMNSVQEDSSTSYLQKSYDVSSFNTQASTDFDISGEELVDASTENDKYHNFSRIQLLELIQKQEKCIQALEATVERYQRAQERLFEHVDALRIELSEIRITPLESVAPSGEQN